jgi:hypothetical protein
MHTHSSSRFVFRCLMLAIALLALSGAGLTAFGVVDSEDLSQDHGSLDQKVGSPMPRSIPVGLRIPAVKVDTGAMLKLGVGKDGNLQVPSTRQAKRPGWYSHSVTPGERGVSVLVSRFISSFPRSGSFLKIGDDIHVKRSDGKTVTFTVTEVMQRNGKSIAATSLDLESKRPELLLIAPGGGSTNGNAHHETGKGNGETGKKAKGDDYYNVVFSAELMHEAAEK